MDKLELIQEFSTKLQGNVANCYDYLTSLNHL